MGTVGNATDPLAWYATAWSEDRGGIGSLVRVEGPPPDLMSPHARIG